MAGNIPAGVELALQQLAQGFKAVGLQDIDLEQASWAEIEKGVARLLGGSFDPQRQDHQAVALGVAAILGKRLVTGNGGFYAANRESPDGMIIGFPDAIIMLSPISAALDALSRAQLAKLEDLTRDVRAALGQARLSIEAGKSPRLQPEDYERLFDPGFLQFVALDQKELKKAWEDPVSGVVRDLRDAFGRAGKELQPDIARQLESQLVGALGSLEQQKGLVQQPQAAGRLVEVIPHLVATAAETRPAPEDFWGAVVFPLLFIGAPESFPPLDEEETQALEQGVDPLFLYLDVVPYQTRAPDEGLLGAFSADQVQLPHEALAGLTPLRLLKIDLSVVGPALETFDAQKSLDAFKRFAAYLKEKTGKDVDLAPREPVFREAGVLLGELKKVWDARDKGFIALRRITEAEAATDGSLAAVRKAMHGPRIILA